MFKPHWKAYITAHMFVFDFPKFAAGERSIFLDGYVVSRNFKEKSI